MLAWWKEEVMLVGEAVARFESMIEMYYRTPVLAM